MKSTKRCIICEKVKNKRKHYRIVNAVTGYTSKTCRACESSIGINLPDDNRSSKGFIYLVFDSAFPEYIKIGYTTNYERRLQDYNKSRPSDTCSYVYISKILTNVITVEENILKRVNVYTQSTPTRKEWFLIKYKEKLIEEIRSEEFRV